jgi:hypothetical protein
MSHVDFSFQSWNSQAMQALGIAVRNRDGG